MVDRKNERCGRLSGSVFVRITTVCILYQQSIYFNLVMRDFCQPVSFTTLQDAVMRLYSLEYQKEDQVWRWVWSDQCRYHFWVLLAQKVHMLTGIMASLVSGVLIFRFIQGTRYKVNLSLYHKQNRVWVHWYTQKQQNKSFEKCGRWIEEIKAWGVKLLTSVPILEFSVFLLQWYLQWNVKDLHVFIVTVMFAITGPTATVLDVD